MDMIRWLLVGAGDIAKKRVAPALAGIPGSQLVAVCDPRIDAADQLADAYNVAYACRYRDLDTALAQAPVDAVYLATPVWRHADGALRALAAGKHVLIEKPLALSAPEAARVVAAAQASGTYAACAYFRRFSPRYRHLREMLERGEFARLLALHLTYQSWFSPAPDDPKYWRVVRERSGGGPLSDMGTHMFDVLIGLFGLPARVFARCANLTGAWDVEDSAAITMTLPDGALVTASFHWNSQTWRHEFDVVGTAARVTWLPYDSGPVIMTVGRETTELDLPHPDNVHRPLIEDFVTALRDGRPPAYPLAESAKANVLLDAIYQSAREGREVEPADAILTEAGK